METVDGGIPQQHECPWERRHLPGIIMGGLMADRGENPSQQIIRRATLSKHAAGNPEQGRCPQHMELHQSLGVATCHPLDQRRCIFSTIFAQSGAQIMETA
jgi:hypothetical protein